MEAAQSQGDFVEGPASMKIVYSSCQGNRMLEVGIEADEDPELKGD